jgi:O-acetylserine/cysteine efflux transporter
MSPKDYLLALFVIVAWGLNFVVIKIGLHGVPPMLLGALRFLLAALPAVFFVRRPQVPLRWMLAYGMTISVGQFAFLFTAMKIGMPAGLASLVLQSQAFFTLALAALFLGERLRAANLLGLLIAAAGLAVISSHSTRSMSAAGFGLTLCAALMWAVGNIVTKKLGKQDLLGVIIWSSLIPPLPFLALSLIFEGPAQIGDALRNISGTSVLVVVYLAFVATLMGYTAWSRLLSRYPAGLVAPLTLLVPVVGLASSWLLLGERLTGLQVVGGLLALTGLAVNVFGARVAGRLRRLVVAS